MKIMERTVDRVEAAIRCIWEDPRDIATELGIKKNQMSRICAEVFGWQGIKRYRRRLVWVEVPKDPAIRGYIAGIIDGEGWITRLHDGTWKVGVANTNKNLCDWLGSFGGYVYSRGARNREIFGAVKDSYQWQLQRHADVLEFCHAIAPYMIIKKDKAEQAIAELLQWWTDEEVTRIPTVEHYRQTGEL